jgi:hypothetical protein
LEIAYRLAGPVIGWFKAIWGFAAPSDFAALPLGVLAVWLLCFVNLPIYMAFAANGVHFHHPNRRALADVLTSVQAGCTVAEAGELLFPNAARHLKSPEEMRELFALAPDAIRRTLEVANIGSNTLTRSVCRINGGINSPENVGYSARFSGQDGRGVSV